MSISIKVSEIVGNGFPPNEGETLADVLLSKPDWNGLTLDVRGCHNGVLISSFVNALLQTIADNAPERLTSAKKLKWTTAFTFQSENIREWVKRFHPVDEAMEA